MDLVILFTDFHAKEAGSNLGVTFKLVLSFRLLWHMWSIRRGPHVAREQQTSARPGVCVLLPACALPAGAFVLDQQ